MKDESLEKLARECVFEFYRASGPGGQHRNKVETGVRVLHVPSGLRAQATERRSQGRNRAEALRRLAEAIAAKSRKKRPRVPTKRSAADREKDLVEKRRLAEKKRARTKTLRDDE